MDIHYTSYANELAGRYKCTVATRFIGLTRVVTVQSKQPVNVSFAITVQFLQDVSDLYKVQYHGSKAYIHNCAVANIDQSNNINNMHINMFMHS